MTWENAARRLGFSTVEKLREKSLDFHPRDDYWCVTECPDGRFAEWDRESNIITFGTWNEAVEDIIDEALVEYGARFDPVVEHFKEHPSHRVGVSRGWDEGTGRIVRFRLSIIDASGRDVGAGLDEWWGEKR